MTNERLRYPVPSLPTRRLAIDAFGIVLALLLGACSSHSGSSTAPEPITECQAYDSEFLRCTGRAAAVTLQTASLEHSVADRARLKSLCVTNLQRLRETCR